MPHRPPQLVCLPGGEPCCRDGHLHALLLEERHAQRALEHRLEQGMGIRHFLEAGAPPQERMHHVALDRARADERHFHDEVIEGARLHAREGVHLRPALHLEEADRVGTAEVVIHRRVIHRDAAEIEGDAACPADVEQAVLQQREHAQPQEIDLHQSHGIEVVLLPLDDGAARHRGRLDGHDA